MNNNKKGYNRSNGNSYNSYDFDNINSNDNDDARGKVRIKNITQNPKCRIPNKIIIFRENILEYHVIMPFRTAKEGVMPFRTWQRHGDGTPWVALTKVGVDVCLIEKEVTA